MKQKILLFINLLIFINYTLFSQTKIVRGRVISIEDKEGLPGASVVELDKNNRVVKGTTTDVDGNYAISVNDMNNKLQVSFVGYKTITIDIANRSVINFTLEPEVMTLGAVEVVGERRVSTGIIDIKERDLAVPVQKIDTRQLQEVHASSIDQAIQGRLAGVDIVSTSGDPGSGMSIRIRGVNTLRAENKPLIVIDGIPYDINISPDFNFAAANEEGYAQMLNISVDDIKEITVLKDAAATSLYGTRAANGVLYISTKRGFKGIKPTINYTYRGTYTLRPRPIKMLTGDQFSTLIYEGYMNSYGVPLPTDLYKELAYDPSDPWWYYNYSQNTNWLKEITRSGMINNHDLSLAGGGEKVQYRFSTNYNDEIGITRGTDLKRLTARLNLDYNISDKLLLRSDLSYAHGMNHASYDRYLWNKAYLKMPNMSVYQYDENGNMLSVYFSPEQNIQGRYPNTYNPVAMADYGLFKTTSDRIITKFNLTYKIIRGLRYSFDVSFDLENTKRNYFLPQIATGLPFTDLNVNRATDRDEDKYVIYTNNKLEYVYNYKNIHNLTLVLNFNTYDYKGLSFVSTTANTASSELQDPSIPSKIQESGLGLSSGSWQIRENGILGMLNYNLLDRYIFALSARREGNSKFDEKFRYGIYPSLSFAWRISGEPFMKKYSFIDDLRLRFSYGENGIAPRDPYLYFNNYSTFSWTYLGYTAVYPSNMQLENLKWETLKTKNAGITLELFKSRLMLDFDIYQNRTEDMLASGVAISSVSGYNSMMMNLGTLDNQGWDFNFRSVPIKKENFTMTFDFNIARNYNILREVAENFPLERGRTTSNGEYKLLVQVDNPIGSFYGYKYLGVYKDEEDCIAVDANGNKIYDANGNPVYMVYNYPSVNYRFQPGDAKYADINHDGNINYLDVVYLGDANPDFTGGFGSSITYKNFSFNIFFYGRYGNEIVNMTQMAGERMYYFENQTAAVLKRWRKPGDQTDIPRALLYSGYNWLGSSRFVDDGSFLRLKYLTISYNFPTKFTNKLGLKNLKISATMNNILTFTRYKGQDPEVAIRPIENTIFIVAYDYSQAPVNKQVTFNLSVTF